MANGEPDIPARPPCFFFSYAHHDKDRYLETFFEDLSDRVAKKGFLNKETGEVSFRDLSNIETGEDWETKIAKALQSSRALVSMYSVAYFQRPYCGKEFQVFVERQTWATLQDGTVRNSTHIIPVRWMSKRDFDRFELPPPLVEHIQDSHDQHEKLYRKLGMWGIMAKRGRNRAYKDIVEDLADRLLDLCTSDDELPPSDALPVLDEVPNPFGTPTSATSTGNGPGTLLLIHLTSTRAGVTAPETWAPYKHASRTYINRLIEESARKIGLECRVETFDTDAPVWKLVAALQQANTENTIPLVVINLRATTDAYFKTVLRQVLDTPDWRGGVLLPVDVEDADALQALATASSSWQIDEEQGKRILVNTLVGSMATFKQNFASMLNELQRRAVKDGQVHREVTGDGPSSKPLTFNS